MVILTDGILNKAYNSACNGIMKYRGEKHAQTYKKGLGEWNAEPEFSGKYIDICAKYYSDTKNDVYLNMAYQVVSSIKENQGKDGYLGMLPDDMRWKNFSVWNQAFTVLGLLSFYHVTGNEQSLAAAEKCACYVAEYYLNNRNVDILDAGNYGTQNISFLIVLPDLYNLTKNKLFYDFMLYIADRMKASQLNFFEFDDILKLQSPKAIENFVILLGMIEYGKLTGDKTALSGAEKYWQQVNDTQIRNTGNGSIHETWVKDGNKPAILDKDCRPNETCVSVGWIELSLKLFYNRCESKYLDAIEKTLYNHLLGSLSDDGTDFAYYQPNFGEKIFSTSEDMYKCCRYRGYTFFAYLREMLYYVDETQLIPMIFCSSVFEDTSIKLVQTTDYPFDMNICFEIIEKKETNRKLKLHIPSWCESFNIKSYGEIIHCEDENGYIVFKGSGKVELKLDVSVKQEYGIINDKQYCAFSYGPLLLARVGDDENADISIPYGKKPQLDSVGKERLSFKISGIQDNKRTELFFCDYASAGRKKGEKYNVWIPVE